MNKSKQNTTAKFKSCAEASYSKCQSSIKFCAQKAGGFLAALHCFCSLVLHNSRVILTKNVQTATNWNSSSDVVSYCKNLLSAYEKHFSLRMHWLPPKCSIDHLLAKQERGSTNHGNDHPWKWGGGAEGCPQKQVTQSQKAKLNLWNWQLLAVRRSLFALQFRKRYLFE